MQNMEPLMVHYGVNLVIQGHNHAYVRTRSMIGNKVDQTNRGPVYLTVGAGGNSHSKGPLNIVPEPWVAHRDHTEFGYVELLVVNQTHARLSRILNRGVDANATARDEAWILNHDIMTAA